MLKWLPACAVACVFCLPAAVDGRALTFRQYREVTTCVLYGGELLLTAGAPEWLSPGESLSGVSLFSDSPVRRPFELEQPSATRRVDQLACDELRERCRLIEQSENARELAATLSVDCQVVVMQPISAELVQSTGVIADTLIAFDSPALGGHTTSAGFADVSSDPALLLRLAMVLAVGCFPPLLRDYTQRPLIA